MSDFFLFHQFYWVGAGFCNIMDNVLDNNIILLFIQQETISKKYAYTMSFALYMSTFTYEHAHMQTHIHTHTLRLES